MRDPSSKPGRKAQAEPPPSGSPAQASAKDDATRAPNAAFDVWLERGLHTLFDTIAQEPIPDALLKIIEEDRKKR